MLVFESVIALLLLGAALAAISRRIGAPYPALVAFAGAILALVPGVPSLTLDPELALALFVAPVLIDAAFDASPRDLRAYWKPVTSLALGAVALTIALVAFVARSIVPDMNWATAIALGAVVAPPDAAAATTVLKHLKPPHRLLTILEGESLFNDASALLVYRLAVVAAVTGKFSIGSIVPAFLATTVGSVVLGFALSRASLFISARIRDVATAVVVQFGSTFAVWIFAERLHLSGIITIVVFAMSSARRVSEIVPARIRVPAWAVWEVSVFVLNLLAFILVGFQLRSVLANLKGGDGARFAIVSAAICGTVIVARIAWVVAASSVSRWHFRPHPSARVPHSGADPVGLSVRGAAVVGWAGMRGTVTLATALALPPDFPYRDLILTTAFAVTLGTLVLQGLTLRPLLLALGLKDDGSVDREVRLARFETLGEAVRAASASPAARGGSGIRARYEIQFHRAREAYRADRSDLEKTQSNVQADPRAERAAPSEREAPGDEVSKPPEPNPDESDPLAGDSAVASVESAGSNEEDAAVIDAAMVAQRERLLALRSNGTIGDAAFQRVEEELDWMELGWESLLRVGRSER